MSKLHEVVYLDDWVAYVVDGVVEIEGHSFRFGDGFRMKEKYPDLKYGDIKFREATDDEKDYAEMYGHFPTKS